MSEQQSTALTTPSQPTGAPLAFLHDAGAFEHLWRVSKAFSASRMVPQHFQGKPEDCMVALMMAQQLEVNPLLCLQNTQVISGRPGFSASFAIAMANTRGPFMGPITWSTEGSGDSLAVTAQATVRATGELVSARVDMAMAKAEGWTKNPKYRSIPEQMLRYRSATWLIRLHCPEVLLGLSTAEELVDVQPVRVQEEKETGSTPVLVELNQRIRKKAATTVLEAGPEETPTEQPELTHQPSIEEVEQVVEVDDPFQ